MSSDPSFDVEAIRKDFPILPAQVHGVPLVYLDCANTSQKPQVVLDTDRRLLRAAQRQRRPRGAHAGLRGDHAVRGGPRQGGRVHQRAASRGGRVHQEHLRGAEPGRVLVVQRHARSGRRAVPDRPGRQDRRDRDGAPLATSCRGSCWPSAPARRSAGSRSTRTAGWSSPRSTSVINERTKVVSFVHQSNALGTVNPVRADRGPRAGGRRADASSTPPSPRRTARWTCRRSAPISSRSPATRCTARPGRRAVGPLRAAGRAAAVPRRRRDDRDGRHVRHHLRRAAAPVRGRHADDRPGGRARRGDRLPHRDRDGRHRSPRAGADRVRAGRVWPTCPACASSARASRVDRGATISFTLDGIHPHDVSQLLDEQGIAVRAGHHCARPVCVRYGIPATTRASFGIYTTPAEIDALVAGVAGAGDVR